MPYPAHVQAELDTFTRELTNLYRQALTEIRAEAEQVAAGIEQNPRLWRRQERLVELELRIVDSLERVDDQARTWIARRFPEAYELGGDEAADVIGDAFGWSQPHYDAVATLAGDLHGELLEATEHVARATKRTIREVVRSLTGSKVTTGRTAVEAGRSAAARLRQLGVPTVTYRNGRRYDVTTYAEMAVRTKTGVAYNAGIIGHSGQAGVRYLEVLDGASCGWDTHDSPDRAHGTVRSIRECAATPLSHPNCRRSFGPRPDVTTAQQAAEAQPSGSPDAAADQAEFERKLEERRAQRARRRAGGGRSTRASRARTPGETSRGRPTRAAQARARQAAREASTPLGREVAALRASRPAEGWIGGGVRDGESVVDFLRRTDTAGSHRGSKWYRMDGGPSAEALQHLDTVKRAGKAVDDAIRGRLLERGLVDPAEMWRATEAVNLRRREYLDKARRARSPERRAEWIRKAQNLTSPHSTFDELDAALAWQAAYRDEMAKALAEVRPMGGKLNLTGPSWAGEQVDAVAARYMPADWVEASNRRGALDVLEQDGRGYYLDRGADPAELVLYRGQANLPGGGPSDGIAVHELTHRMEHSVPEIRALEWSYHWSRTGRLDPDVGVVLDREPAVLLRDHVPGSNYRSNELTRPDQWRNPYMGKMYGDGPGSSWEVASMGVEGIVNGRFEMFLDHDYRQFVLGLWSMV